MNTAIFAIIKKDFRSVTANRRLFASLLIVPLVLTIVLPSVFVFLIHMTPDDPDIQSLLNLLPQASRSSSLELTVFFLIIPIMTASIMAASSFVGEKEKRTLETLLYSPLTVGQIFRAKVLASFLLSMMVSLISFTAMTVVLEAEIFLLMGTLLLPGAAWIIILLLVAPAISLIAVTLIVRGSAKATTVEESQQSAVFLILPLLLLLVGQFSGVLLLSGWILLILGGVCALLAWLLLRKAAEKFTCERLLK